MSQYRDLMALQRQVDRLQRVKQPPTLRMVRIFDESRPEEPIGEYTLTYRIESPLDWRQKTAQDLEGLCCQRSSRLNSTISRRLLLVSISASRANCSS